MAEAALVERLQPGDHVCWSFADDAERRRVTAAYVRAGLHDQHRIIYLSSGREPAAALAELTADRVDAAAAARSGRLRVVAADTYLAGGRFDPAAAQEMFAAEVRQARRSGFPGLRALGDMAWAVRGRPGSERLAGYERDVNRLYAGGYAMAICLYDRRLFGEPARSELARAHPATVTPRTSRADGPLLRMRRTGDGLRLAGEADLSNRDAVAAVLGTVLDDVHTPQVTLDLSDLTYADAGACRLIVTVALRSGGRLRTAGARASLTRLLSLQGARTVPGLLPDPPGAS